MLARIMVGLRVSGAPSRAGDMDCWPCYSRGSLNWYGDDGRG